ncbi:MAG TPA: ABC transporter ATP-binding protein [Candidatus Dormibacteraeota bacterium]
MSLEVSARVRLGSLDLDVELAVADGEVVALLGPNGAGKSTLLRVLAGLQPLDGGRVVLDGAVLDDAEAGRFVPPERRPVGFVFQDYLLFPHLTVLDNVEFGLRSRGLPPARAREWLARVGLGELASARPAALSGGQAQRVALARALATDPRLLLLDEPLAALDASSRAALRRELKRHLESFGGIRLVVTHDPVEAAALADRVVVLEAGRVLQSGSHQDITARPRSRYVADLAGVNLWRGIAAAGQVRIDGATLAAIEPHQGEVFVTVQPRAVALFRNRPDGTPRNVWRGRAAGVDYLGDRARVRLEGTLPIVAEVSRAAVDDLGLAGGAEVWIAVKAAEVEVYPA